MISLRKNYATKNPYGEWLDSNLIQLKDLKIPNRRFLFILRKKEQDSRKHFGYTLRGFQDINTSYGS